MATPNKTILVAQQSHSRSSQTDSLLGGHFIFRGDAMRKIIVGYDGYEADEFGNIWSVSSNWRGYGARILKKEIDRHGYYRVRVYRNGKRVKKQVHLLVALAWCGESKDGVQVRHLDGSRTNNAPSNLSLGTAKENANDRLKHGRTAFGIKNGMNTKPLMRSHGSKNGMWRMPWKSSNAKLQKQDIEEIRKRLSFGESQSSIARHYGINNSNINRIARGKAWVAV